jgi:hypothetical protein
VVKGLGNVGEKLGLSLANRAFGTGFRPLLVKSRTRLAVRAMGVKLREIETKKESEVV